MTAADRAKAAEVTARIGFHDPELDAAIAVALADERERALASCYGLHPRGELVVTGPGIVTCDGHELRWTAKP